MLKSYSIGLNNSNHAPRRFASGAAVPVAWGPANTSDSTLLKNGEFSPVLSSDFISYLQNSTLGRYSANSYRIFTCHRLHNPMFTSRHRLVTPLPRRTPVDGRLGTSSKQPYNMCRSRLQCSFVERHYSRSSRGRKHPKRHSNNGELPSVFPSNFCSDPRYGTAGHHSTHPEEIFYSTRSLQLNARDLIAASHIAHDERPPNTGSKRLQNSPTTYVGAVCNVRLSNTTVPGTGKVENERDGTFFKSGASPPLFSFTFSSNLRNDISGHQSTTTHDIFHQGSTPQPDVDGPRLSTPAFFVDELILNAGPEDLQNSSTAFVYTVPGVPPSNVAVLVAGEAEDSRDGTLPNSSMFPIQISFNFVPICEMALQSVVLQVSTKFFIPHILHNSTLARCTHLHH